MGINIAHVTRIHHLLEITEFTELRTWNRFHIGVHNFPSFLRLKTYKSNLLGILHAQELRITVVCSVAPFLVLLDITSFALFSIFIGEQTSLGKLKAYHWMLQL